MTNQSSLLTKHHGGWALIALMVVVAIIALLMVVYLPGLLQSYQPPTTTDEDGKTVPVLESIEGQLAPIDTRNQQLEDYLNPNDQPEEDQP